MQPRARNRGSTPTKNERVELEMQIMKHRQFLLLAANEAFLRAAKEKLAELEKKLREIDE